MGDEERLALALDCLVENALKATNEGDPISISGRADGETACLEVADSGIGIAKEDQARVFERFSRLNRTAARNGGTGLGLAIVKAVAEAHGGRVELESEPGRGATFRVWLEGFVPAPSGGLSAGWDARPEARDRPDPAAAGMGSPAGVP